MCKVLKVHPSGYYAWVKEPESRRDQENKEILNKIKEAYEQSNRTYGYRNIHKDLLESGVNVNKKRVARWNDPYFVNTEIVSKRLITITVSY